MTDAKKIRNAALEDAALEVAGIMQPITHPNGRRAFYVDSLDMAALDALNDAVIAIRALKEPEE